MPIIHIPELARLMLDYLEPAEAYVLGLLLGDIFPKMIHGGLSTNQDCSSDEFKFECMEAIARAGWVGGPAKIVARFPTFPYNHTGLFICTAFEHGQARVAMEIHEANVHLATLRQDPGAARELTYSAFCVRKLARSAMDAKMESVLVEMLGPKCRDALLSEAAAAGRLETLDYLYAPGPHTTPRHAPVGKDVLLVACRAAARGGHLSALQHLVRCSKSVWDYAWDSDGLSEDELYSIRRTAEYWHPADLALQRAAQPPNTT